MKDQRRIYLLLIEYNTAFFGIEENVNESPGLRCHFRIQKKVG